MALFGGQASTRPHRETPRSFLRSCCWLSWSWKLEARVSPCHYSSVFTESKVIIYKNRNTELIHSEIHQTEQQTKRKQKLLGNKGQCVPARQGLLVVRLSR